MKEDNIAQQTPETGQASGQQPTEQPTPPETGLQPPQGTTLPSQNQEDPGKTLSIIALVAAFFLPLVGFILGLVARSKSKKAGHKNTLAIVSIILSIIFTLIGLAFFVLVVLLGVGAVQDAVRECRERGPGTHTLQDGSTLTCGKSGNSFEYNSNYQIN